jgi:hypothetical protein
MAILNSYDFVVWGFSSHLQYDDAISTPPIANVFSHFAAGNVSDGPNGQ